MSQKDQEAAIDEKIERIRKKNEEIKRRYLEVEADKLNAAKLNATVKFTPSETKNTDRKPFSRPPATSRNPRFEKKVPDKPYTAKLPTHVKKFTDGDGPPPDPVYTFLSDHSRDQPRGDYSPDSKTTRDNTSGDESRGQRGRGRGRGWNRGRGSPIRGSRRGGNTGNQFSRQGPQLQPEYQAWRAEREKIDQDRITRQKTAEGNWRREWDSEKLSQDGNQEYQARPSFSKKKKRDSEEMKIQRTVTNELAKASPPSKENEPRLSEKSVKSDSYAKGVPVDKKSVVFSFSGGGTSSNEIIDDDLEENLGFEHRNIISCGDSIKISLSNKPIRSVKVNPVNSAGTGRVGPRQKPLLSYSSQSEDEKEIHPPVFRKRSPPTFSPKEAVPLPPRDEASSKKPPLPPSRGSSREFGSPKKKSSALKVESNIHKKELESPVAERKELSRESSHENVSEGGDDSWEDVATTSGNESADCSDADVAKQSDVSDNFTERDQNIDDGGRKAAMEIMAAPDGEYGNSDEGGGARYEELCEQRDGFHDEIDEEVEVQLSMENYEAAGEGSCSGIDVEPYKEHDDSSLEIAKELNYEGITSAEKMDSPHEEELAQVSRMKHQSSGEEDDCPIVEEKSHEIKEKAKGGDSIIKEATVEASKCPEKNTEINIQDESVGNPTESLMDRKEVAEHNLSAERASDQFTLHRSPDLPESLQKENDPKVLKEVETGESHLMIENEITITGRMDIVNPTEHKDGPDGTSAHNDACSPTV